MTYAPCCDDTSHGLQPTSPESTGWRYEHGPTGIIRPAFSDTRSVDLATERPRTGRPACSDCGTPLDPKWCSAELRAGGTPIAIGLLEAEHERLLRDHYDDDDESGCDGCVRAAAIRNELERLS